MKINFLNNSIIATKDEKGIWIYKSDPNYKGPFKKDGTLTQFQKDMPRFSVIIEAENELLKEYNQSLISSVKEMSHILNSFGN